MATGHHLAPDEGSRQKSPTEYSLALGPERLSGPGSVAPAAVHSSGFFRRRSHYAAARVVIPLTLRNALSPFGFCPHLWSRVLWVTVARTVFPTKPRRLGRPGGFVHRPTLATHCVTGWKAVKVASDIAGRFAKTTRDVANAQSARSRAFPSVRFESVQPMCWAGSFVCFE
jgi:hypothetical protein